MRRTINGILYDTALATAVVSARWQEDVSPSDAATDIFCTLYHTAEGAYFLHIQSETEGIGDRAPHLSNELVPCVAAHGDSLRQQDILDRLCELFAEPWPA